MLLHFIIRQEQNFLRPINKYIPRCGMETILCLDELLKEKRKRKLKKND